MEDIFAYAAKRVANKDIWSRVKHSSTLHSVRSATQAGGSFGSKGIALAGVAFRATANAIPIPVVGGLVAAIEARLEAFAKAKRHESNLKAATTTLDKVKFTLKELNVEDMDRYRWKANDALLELNEVVRALPERSKTASETHCPCDVFYEAAYAFAQAQRRMTILKEAAAGLVAAMALTVEWVSEVETGAKLLPALPAAPASDVLGGMAGTQSQIRSSYKDFVDTEHLRWFKLQERGDAYIKSVHAYCGDFCIFRAAGKVDTFAATRDRLAEIARELAKPFNPDSFNNNLGSLWKVD
jgi:hypothetical protein